IIDQAGTIFFSPSEAPAPSASLFASESHAVLIYRRRQEWFCIDPRNQRRLELKHLDVGTPVDSALLAYAAEQNYPSQRLRYLPISPGLLRRLGDQVVWLRGLDQRQRGMLSID